MHTILYWVIYMRFEKDLLCGGCIQTLTVCCLQGLPWSPHTPWPCHTSQLAAVTTFIQKCWWNQWRVTALQQWWCWRLLFLYWNPIALSIILLSTSRAEDPGFKLCLAGIFSGSSHDSDLNIGTPVATLPGAWCYRVSAGTGWPGVSILWLGEMESLVCNFYLSVAAREIVWADLSLRYTCMLLGR